MDLVQSLPSLKGAAKENTLLAIGSTPLVKLNKLTRGLDANIYVKLEFYNPTGSYKDRMALAMIEGAERDGLLKKGGTVVEYTGGSTGSSLAFVCAVKGYRLKIVTSDAFSEEKLNTMRAFGAELTIVPSEGGKITPELLPKMMKIAEEMGKEPATFRTNQFYNKHMLEGYKGMGNEILDQLDGNVDAFVASFGTAGCAMGVAQVLKSVRSKKIGVYLVEPKESPIVSKGIKGTHHIEGMGPGFVPPLLSKELYDEILTVSTEEAQEMARRLAREEGIFSGSSTGANVAASLLVARKLGRGNIVTVAVDSGLKYLSTEVYRSSKSSSMS